MINNELIVVKQLPQIEEHLKELSTEIDKKVENAKNLICTEENVKTIKQVRAELNKEFKDVEQQRKAVKEQVLAPYMQFEEIYKHYVSDKYKSADIDLKNKVDSVELELKIKKQQEIKDYFEEYKKTNEIDFITYEQAKINVTLSASMKSLKEEVKQFIDKIVSDLKLIETQQNKNEILVEYKKDLNVSRAITEVVQRKEELKALEEKRINTELEKEKQVLQDNLTNLANANIPQEISRTEEEIQNDVKMYTITFKVTDTSVRLKKLHDFLVEGGYKYE